MNSVSEITGLTTTDKQAIEASLLPKVKNLSDLDISNKINDVLTVAISNLGTKLNDDDRDAMGLIIMDNLKAFYPNLTLKELELAVRKGSLGGFAKPDDVVFLSPKTIQDWIKAYVEQVKREAIAKLRDFEAKKEKTATPDEEEKKRIEQEFVTESILKPYQKFMETGEYDFKEPCGIVYDHLDRKGLISYDNAKKRIIYKLAEEEFKKKHSEGRDLKEIHSNRIMMNLFEKGDTSTMNKIKNMAKSMTLKMILTELKENEMELKDLLEE